MSRNVSLQSRHNQSSHSSVNGDRESVQANKFGSGGGGFRRASSAQPRSSHITASSGHSHPTPSLTDTPNSRKPPTGSHRTSATLAGYGISARPPCAVPKQPRTQVCRSCHKFLKHVLHTNTCANYFSKI